jgi:hypothetical protein
MNLPLNDKGELARFFAISRGEPPPGSASPYLIVLPAVVALRIGKNCTFGSDRDRPATMNTPLATSCGIKDQAVIRLNSVF